VCEATEEVGGRCSEGGRGWGCDAG
jgi:hypothetical protein